MTNDELKEIETSLWNLRPEAMVHPPDAYTCIHRTAEKLSLALRESWGRIDAMKAREP